MFIKEIYYASTVQVNEMTWNKIGVTASLDINDDPDNALKVIKAKVEEYHAIPPTTPTISTNTIDKKDNNEKDELIRGVLSSTEIEGEDGLKSFELRARNTPGALEIYNVHLSKLLEGKPTDKQIAKSHFRKNGKVKLP